MSKTLRSRIASKKSLLLLSFMALGVVYGDIGTSPLYAINEIFFGHGKTAVSQVSVFGAISLVFWALTLVVTLKYVLFVLRAEYDGEGGIFALLGLLRGMSARGIFIISSLLLLAAGLLFGDGIITPAISVLSAVEGLRVGAPALTPYITPIAVIILTALFAIQYKGTASLGRVFGAVMSVWFVVIALLGLNSIIQYPLIFKALNPIYGLHFISSIGLGPTMIILGAVVLTVTGGEALYADLGHFGVLPIRLSWLSFVYPALVLNYLGQGAFLLGGSKIIQNNIFFSMVPSAFLFPMILLATLATVIASQALISGAFSLTAQAIALGVSPRFKIVHTNHKHHGQIYVPAINWALYIGCIALVLAFKSSTSLASAYGLAETGVMISTSIAMFAITLHRWRWSIPASICVFGSFALIDAAFLFSNSLKFFEGGYVPFLIGIVLFVLMSTWQWGRNLVAESFAVFSDSRRLEWLIDLKKRLESAQGLLNDKRGPMVGTNRAVIFMTRFPIKTKADPVPMAARLYIKRIGALPKAIIMLNVSIKKEPYLEGAGYEVIDFGSNIHAINAQFGFMEDPNIRNLIKEIYEKNLIPYDVSRCTVQVAEEELILDKGLSFLNFIRARLFKMLSQFATPTYRYFGLNADTNVQISATPIHLSSGKAQVIKLLDDDLAI